jgi:hypothetical protein
LYQGIRILNILILQNWPMLKLGAVVLVLGGKERKKVKKKKKWHAGLCTYADIKRRHVIDKVCSSNSCGTLLLM